MDCYMDSVTFTFDLASKKLKLVLLRITDLCKFKINQFIIIDYYSFRQSPKEALVETMWKAPPVQLGGIIQTVDSSYIYFKGF
jgi:hypothetical protein